MRTQNRVQIREQVFYFRSRQLVAPRGHDRGVSHGFSTSPDDLSFVFVLCRRFAGRGLNSARARPPLQRTRRAACRAECL